MNAPARIPSDVKRSARRDAYIPIVTAHLPGCAGEELQMRCGMLLMRDSAAARLRWITEEPGYVLEHIQRLTSKYALAIMPFDDLQMLYRTVMRLGMSAAALATLFPAAPAEGADARG